MFQDDLLNWYHTHHRKLPWRESHDPYKIWLSEVMLQQTQVITVIDYFNKFIKRYPTVMDMARADEEDVLKLWEGLGYYSRARRLIPCARMVLENYDGVFPNNLHEMLKLPGVGSYTAGAILSIAYNKKTPAVDGNVMRVFARYFGINDDISAPKTKKVFEEKVMHTLPNDRRHFNQALMELGATVCTPRNVKCEVCPIQTDCHARKNDQINTLPVKSKKIKKRTQKMIVCYVVNEGKLMIEKRPSEGLLASMWGFPCFEHDGAFDVIIKDYLQMNYDMDVLKTVIIKEDKHVFTHLIWEMKFVEVHVQQQRTLDLPQTRWIESDELNDFALPKAFKRLIEV